MIKRLFSFSCVLQLLLFGLSIPAGAENALHSCIDETDDYLCDICHQWLEHTCTDEDGDNYCDLCGQWLEHECIDEDMDCYCDICLWYIYHDCVDLDGDWYCETCGHWMSHTCMDEDGNWFCDECKLGLPIYWRLTIFAEGNGHITCNFGDFRDDIKDGVASYWWIQAGQYWLTASKPGFVSRDIAVTIGPKDDEMRFKLLRSGDVNGDGSVDIADVANVYACVQGSVAIEDAYLRKCGDVSRDNQLTVADVSRLYAYTRGTDTSLDP